MITRALLLTAVAAFGAGCGPISGTEGELGHGEFSYVCITRDDVACNQSTNLYGYTDDRVAMPAAVAVGMHFDVEYRAHELEDGGHVDSRLRSTAPSILTIGTTFSFTRPGSVSIIAETADGTILDLIDVDAEEVRTLRVDGLAEDGALEIEKSPGYGISYTTTVGVIALGANDQRLAGAMGYTAASSNEEVFTVQPTATYTADGGPEYELVGVALGEADLTLRAAGLERIVHVTVVE
jgi:hypothetical protein